MSEQDGKKWYHRMKDGLSKSSKNIGDKLTSFKKQELDDDALEELEEALITSDMGVESAMEVVERLRGQKFKVGDEDAIKSALAEEVGRILTPVAEPLEVNPINQPHVILVVGVNGAGKTTTIGKLAQKMTDEGKSVILVAGDTFRAAAIEQLKVWGERTNSPVIAKEQGADSASLAFEACQKAQAEGADVVIIDTAGRLQNKADLMHELVKIVKVVRKFDTTAPHDTVLVLDATTGQNALNQIEVFQEASNVTGLIMTKLDGTARGGVLVNVAKKYYETPIHAIGVGEKVEDLEAFDAMDFGRALMGLDKTG